MKTKVIFLIFLITALTSCDSFLEPTPHSTTTTVNYYRTASEAESALNGAYAALIQMNTFGQNLTEIILLGCTDEANVHHNGTNQDRNPWGNGAYDPYNTLLNNVWNLFFSGISRANYLIENLDNVSDFSGNRKVEIEAEARLLRGFIYMYLAQMCGGVPVYTTGYQDPLKARQPLSEVYAQIIEDYTFAYENLPNRNKITGRVNKWSAGGFLCRVYSYLAAAKTSGMSNFGLDLNSVDWVNAQEYYTKTKTIAEDVIRNSRYILIPEYSYLFRESTKQHQYQECLFLLESSQNPTLRTSVVLINSLAPSGDRAKYGGGSSGFRPTGELYYKYVEADKRFRHNLTGRIDANNPPSEIVEGVKYYVPNRLAGPTDGNYCMAKFRQVDPVLKLGLPDWASYISFPLLRFADIILLHAEASYFLGDESTARADLTKVRERSVLDGNTVEDLNLAYYKTNFKEELLDERTRELCFECIRRFDLARFNVYTETIQNLSTSATFGVYNQIVPLLQQNWKPEKIWMPIPQSQMDLNSNLKQNPGYY
jgi:hypothetical protein